MKADPRGLPDYTLPVSILAQIIESLKVDIVSQTLSQLKVDIVAQSLPKLEVDIASVGDVVFNVAQSGTWTINAVQSGSWSINIGSISSGVVFNVNIGSISAGVVFNVAQSGTWTVNAAQSGSWSINIGSVTAGVVFNVNVSSVSAGVTFNVNVTGSVAIDVKTSGGANIVIDKLTQAAYTEDRRTLANNGAAATMLTLNYMYRRGKYFPRGARGFINSIEIYCDNADTVAHTFTIYFCVQPGMAPVFSTTLTVAAGAAAAWRAAAVGKFWNYDSMFIYVRSDSNSYGGLGYDNEVPYDYYCSYDEVTWYVGNARFWFRVVLTGLTVGDLPVSGTVNVVEIPSTVGVRQAAQLIVSPGSEVYDAVQYGNGKLLICIFHVQGANSNVFLRPRIRIDGAQVMPFDYALDKWNGFLVSSDSLGICIGKWDTTNNLYALIVTVPYPFKRTLEVGYYNESTATTFYPYVGYVYEKIS